MRRSVLANLFVALLLASVLSPAVSAAASIAMSADSLAKEATTDDPAEYSIIITNDGDEDLTVTLNTAQWIHLNDRHHAVLPQRRRLRGEDPNRKRE